MTAARVLLGVTVREQFWQCVLTGKRAVILSAILFVAAYGLAILFLLIVEQFSVVRYLLSRLVHANTRLRIRAQKRYELRQIGVVRVSNSGGDRNPLCGLLVERQVADVLPSA